MALWLVAAIAAAGYVANHWRNPSKNNDSVSLLASGDPGLVTLENVSDLNPRTVERCEDCNILTISNLSPALTSDNGNFCGALCPGTLADRVGHTCSDRRKTSLRAKLSGAQAVRPKSSLESCLMALLYSKQSEMDEYVFSSFPSPTAAVVRPLLVRDGRRIICRVNGNYFSPLVRQGETHLPKEGLCTLPEVELLNSSKKKVIETSKGLSTFSREIIPSQRGTCLYPNYNELDASPEQQMDNITNFDFKGQDEQKADGNSDSWGRMEAELEGELERLGLNMYPYTTEDELEAELERLGLNMDSYATERRISNPIELDQDLFTNFTRGELRANIQGGEDMGPPRLYEDNSEVFMNQTENYSVSPRELSLRLHEVIEARLEERIKELEAALENSQKKVQLLESRQQQHDWRSLADYDVGSSPI